MKKISLLTDEYWIPLDLHNALRLDLEKKGFKVDECRCDTSAAGGPIWFASGFVIHISEFIIGLFLTDMVLAQLSKLLGSVKFKERELPLYIGPDSKTYKGKVSVYFSFYSCDKESLKLAIEAIPDAQKELQSILTSDFFKTYKQPEEIVMRYDHNLKKWIIQHFDIDSKIYYDEVTGKYSPKISVFRFVNRIFEKVLSSFK